MRAAPGSAGVSRRSRPWLAGAWAACALLPAVLAAQEAPAPPGLPLERVLESAAERATPVLQARERVAASQGSVLAAGGAFDVRLRTFMGTSRDNTLAFEGPGAPAVSPSHTTGVTYGAAVEKRLRSGIVVGPEIQATRNGTTPRVEARNNVAEAALVLQVPLLRGRGAVNTATERAALRSLAASEADLLHATAQAVRAAAEAYWGYAAAHERLEAQREAEVRARRLVDETRVLIEAEERPAADLNQLLANLAAREAARIGAEQGLVEARHTLGLAMGLAAQEIDGLPSPATAFPVPAEAHLRGGVEAGRLVEEALARRADYRAALAVRDAAGVQARAAEDGLRPRLDVVVSAGYTGAEPGRELMQMVSPFYRSLATWSAGVELSYEFAARNAEARGAAEQGRAAYRQQALAAEEVARTIRSDVRLAVEALRYGQQELARSEEAVRLYTVVVDNEARKFQLGMSTLFEVLQAEDGLTTARVNRTAARARYASALARLAYETGTLVEEDAPRVEGMR